MYKAEWTADFKDESVVPGETNMIEMLLICGTLATGLLLLGRHIQRRVKRARVYGRRDSLAMWAIWQRHFAVLGLDQNRCEMSWLQLARTFRIEPGKLRTTDRFDGELRHLDHLLDGWLLRTLTAAEAETEGLRPDQIKTVRDFIVLAASSHFLPDADWARRAHF